MVSLKTTIDRDAVLDPYRFIRETKERWPFDLITDQNPRPPHRLRYQLHLPSSIPICPPSKSRWSGGTQTFTTSHDALNLGLAKNMCGIHVRGTQEQSHRLSIYMIPMYYSGL